MPNDKYNIPKSNGIIFPTIKTVALNAALHESRSKCFTPFRYAILKNLNIAFDVDDAFWPKPIPNAVIVMVFISNDN